MTLVCVVCPSYESRATLAPSSYEPRGLCWSCVNAVPFRNASCGIWSAPTARFVETIQADSTCPVLLAKTFWFRDHPNQTYKSRRPASFSRGVSRSSRTLGAGCDGRRRHADERRRLRTAKSCGSGAPTLALSQWYDPLMTVAKEPGHRGDHEGNR